VFINTLSAITKKNYTTMVQEFTYSDVLNMAFMLPLEEQKIVIRAMQSRIEDTQVEASVVPYTWDEVKARFETAKQQFATGQYKTHKQVMAHRSM